MQSLESQVNLRMDGVIVLPKVADFDFDRLWSTASNRSGVASSHIIVT